MEEKVFTPDEANRTLPLVRRIVQDVVDAYARWQDGTRELELIAVSARAEQYDERRQTVEQEVQDIAAEISGYERELEDLGILLKDYAIGLVDFPGELDDRPVYLCWRLGEPTVAFWHDRDAGYAGRQPLPASVA